jgi:2-alkyl-3-oxoalkanoate reductase
MEEGGTREMGPSALEGTPVLITGATGFLGSRLAAALAARGARVRALVRPSSDLSRLFGLRLEIVRGDIERAPSLIEATAGQRLVFHAAARVSDWGPRALFVRANVEGTRNVVEACLAAGVERLVHVSSLTVLGLPRDGRTIDESAPYACPPWDIYTATKIEAERVVLGGDRLGLSATIVRPGAIWGVGDPTLLPRLVRLLRDRLLVYIDGGDNRIGLSHVSNVVNGALLAATTRGAGGEIYHLTDGEDITAREAITRLAAALGLTPPWASVPYLPLFALATLLEGAAGAIGRREPPPLTRFGVRVLASDCHYDIAKARRDLGYRPTVSLRSGMVALARSVDGSG